MEVINNLAATVYTRVNIDSEGKAVHDRFASDRDADTGQQVKWKLAYRINKFPAQLAETTSVPYLFSPNFKYQFDVNVRAKQFMIIETETQFVYMKIPRDLITTSWKGVAG